MEITQEGMAMATITAVDASPGAWERVKAAGSTAWGQVKRFAQRVWAWGAGLVKRGWNWLTRNKAAQWATTKAKVAGNFVWRVVQSPITWAVGIVYFVPSIVWVIAALVGFGMSFWIARQVDRAWEESNTPQELWDRAAAFYDGSKKAKATTAVTTTTGPVVAGDVVQETTTITYLADFNPDLITDPDESLEDRKEVLASNAEAQAGVDVTSFSYLTGRLHMVLTRLGDTVKWSKGEAGPLLSQNAKAETAWPHIRARVQAEVPNVNWDLNAMFRGLKDEETRLRKQANMKANR